jgi:hypothetical protein
MRRLYLVAVVFAFACGTPPTGVEAELVGSDASLMAKKGPKADSGRPRGTDLDRPTDTGGCVAEGDLTPCYTSKRGGRVPR